MPRRENSLGGKLSFDTRGASAALRNARREMEQVAADMGRIKAPDLKVGKWTELNAKATAAKNVVEEVYNAISKPTVANVWYEDLRDGLTAVMGNADKAKKHLGELRLISDEQSLSDAQFEQIVNYSIRIQSLGYSAESAAEFIREMANAAEGMGRGVDDLAGMVLSLDKVGQTGEAALKTIMGLSKETPALRKVLENAFGSSTAADLEKLNLSSEQLYDGLLRGMKMLETARPSKSEEGLAAETRKMQWAGADAEDNNGDLPERSQMSADAGALARQRLMDDLRAAADKKAEAARQKQAAATAAEMSAMERMTKLETALAEAKASGDAAAIVAAEDRLDIARDAAKMAADLRISEAEAANFIRSQNAEKRKGLQIEREAQAVKDRAGESARLAIETAKAGGKGKRAERLEKAEFLRSEKERLQGMNFSEKDAAAMAGQSWKNKQDEEFFSKTGKRRIRGGVAENTVSNLDNTAFRLLQKRDEPRQQGDRSNIAGFNENQVMTPARKRREELMKERAGIEKQQSQPGGIDSAQIDRLNSIETALRDINEFIRGAAKPR